MISLPETDSLLPQSISLAGGQTLYTFVDQNTSLLRLDFLHEAGSVYQPQFLCSSTANKLFTQATNNMSSKEVSDFMDYRGIIIGHESDYFTTTTSFYFLQRYLDELLPVLEEFLYTPVFRQVDFDILINRRKQELKTAQQKTGEVARRLFYKTLFGDQHPLGKFACPDDADILTRDVVAHFFESRYGSMNMVLSGMVDNEVQDKVASLARKGESMVFVPDLKMPEVVKTGVYRENVIGATQTSLRIGRVIPLRWDEPDYARFVLLTALLGGYFGSRLMSNLREDKGYTYGVSARTRAFRGVNVFFITADVSSDMAEAAVEEVRHELQRLCEYRIEEDEMDLVKRVVVGDFIRSVDGVFEHAERLCSMLATGVTEQFTDNLRQAIEETTAEQLQELAQRLLSPENMLYCMVGS